MAYHRAVAAAAGVPLLLLIIANVELTEVQVLIAKLQAIVESRNAQT